MGVEFVAALRKSGVKMQGPVGGASFNATTRGSCLPGRHLYPFSSLEANHLEYSPARIPGDGPLSRASQADLKRSRWFAKWKEGN